jgi:hypothetical protein
LAILKHGPCDLHRMSFTLVDEQLQLEFKGWDFLKHTSKHNTHIEY